MGTRITAALVGLVCLFGTVQATAEVLELSVDGQRVYVLASSSVSATPRLDWASPSPGMLEVDVLVYYHGLHGYYSRSGFTNAIETTNLSAVVTASERPLIAILPEAKPGDADRSRAWQRMVTQKGGFERLIDESLAALGKDRGLATLVVSDVAVAAHSGGGAMVGPSVAERGGRYHRYIREVTLLDAGYGYRRSLAQLKTWVLAGKPSRVLRILHGGSASAAYAVEYFRRDRGLTAEAQDQRLALSPQALDDFTLEGLSFDVLEITRGTDLTGTSVTWGTATARGHYAIRDAGLGASARAVTAPAPRWILEGQAREGGP